ncbi:MAG: hypothetical protein HGA19_03770 [Oscillochloris sp.]|nr:hypothetical protein [Oscillochloris sp.]
MAINVKVIELFHDFVAPQVLVVEPGHEGWVVGDEPAVLIEFDFEKDTVQRFGAFDISADSDQSADILSHEHWLDKVFVDCLTFKGGGYGLGKNVAHYFWI